jgi:hypothetical protein
MSVLVAFLCRYLLPFVAGICTAAVVFVDTGPMAVALLLTAALLLFFSLPTGGWMIRRMGANKR